MSCPGLFFEPCLFGSVHFVSRQVSSLCVFVLSYFLFQSVLIFFFLFQTPTPPPLYDFPLCHIVWLASAVVHSHPPVEIVLTCFSLGSGRRLTMISVSLSLASVSRLSSGNLIDVFKV